MPVPTVRSILALILAAAAAACIEQPLIESLPEIDFASVSTGQDHACGLVATGEVYCWSRVDPRPTLVSNGVVFRTISTYWDHTCGVAADGTAYCWGLSSIGQLGVELADLETCFVAGGSGAVPCSSVPAPVAGGLVFSDVSAGAAHTCGLTPDGEAWCWGANGAGQLGTTVETPCDPTLVPEGFQCSTTPVRVDGGHRFASISSGWAHSCAVDDRGDAWCWGFGDAGRLGTGAKDSERVPARVAGGHDFQTVAAGGAHSCGVTVDNRGYCWGSNADGQLGSLVTDPACGIQQYRCLLEPHPVEGDIAFAAISASAAVPVAGAGPLLGGHSCGLTVDGAVYCWGLNTSGQLFNHGDLRSTLPIRLDTEDRFAEISAGLENTCGVTANQRVLCWAFGGPQLRWYVFSNS